MAVIQLYIQRLLENCKFSKKSLATLLYTIMYMYDKHLKIKFPDFSSV